MRHLLFLIGLLGSLLAGGCHQPSAVSAPLTASDGLAANPARGIRFIRFGSGGGFTGATTTYILAADGRLERRRGLPADTVEPATRLTVPPPAAVAQCFRALDALPSDSLTVQVPGNMTYFIEGRTVAGRPVTLRWGAPRAVVPHAGRALYQQLMALVPANE